MQADRDRVRRFYGRLVDPAIHAINCERWRTEDERRLAEEARRNRSLLRRLIDAMRGA